MREAAKIILLATGAGIAFGVLLDQVTVRACVEYFTVAHPPLWRLATPSALAFGWGFVATWWLGLGIGVGWAAAARAGRRSPVSARALTRAVAVLALAMIACATLAATATYRAASAGTIALPPPWDAQIALDRHAVFLGVAAAHDASYAAAALGALGVAAWIWRQRA